MVVESSEYSITGAAEVVRPDAGGADPVLRPYLEAADGSEADRAMASLIDAVAEPVVRRIVQRRWHASLTHPGRYEDPEEGEARDAWSEAIAQVVARLRECRDLPESDPVRDFKAYVAVTTYRACDSLLRRKFPQRWSLKNRLRYLLTHQAGFATWETDNVIAGFEAWCGRSPETDHLRHLRQICDDPASFARQAAPHGDVQQMDWADLLAAVFDAVGGPVPLDGLVSAVAVVLDIRETSVRSLSDLETGAPMCELVPDPRADVHAEVDQRMYLRTLWSEVLQLPVRQRVALLLNLRDDMGRGVIALLPLRGVATMTEIAASLEMRVECFAKVWNDLPLEDSAIADRIGATRQQVINLRKCARERLARRMRCAETQPVLV